MFGKTASTESRRANATGVLITLSSFLLGKLERTTILVSIKSDSIILDTGMYDKKHPIPSNLVTAVSVTHCIL